MSEEIIDVPKELILRLREENEKMLKQITKLEKKLKRKEY